jgi:hypothetical protein
LKVKSIQGDQAPAKRQKCWKIFENSSKNLFVLMLWSTLTFTVMF